MTNAPTDAYIKAIFRIGPNDLHALLDSLAGGEHVKATWQRGSVKIAAEGPVYVDGSHCACSLTIRTASGTINKTLTSIEVTRDEEIAFTRDDEVELHALLDSLEDGEEVTAEWRDENGSITITGMVRSDGCFMFARGPVSFSLRGDDGGLHPSLRSITVRRPVVHRWERGSDE